MPFVQRTDGAVSGLYANPQPQPDGSDLAPEWLADDHPDVIVYLHPAAGAAQIAYVRLRETDYVEFRVWTPARTPSPAWLAWREALREVARGNATVIPDEPPRYGAAQPAPVVVADDDLTIDRDALADLIREVMAEAAPAAPAIVIPEALTGFVLVDEAPADTRARLAARWQELTHLLQMGLADSDLAHEHTLLSAHQGWLTS